MGPERTVSRCGAEGTCIETYKALGSVCTEHSGKYF